MSAKKKKTNKNKINNSKDKNLKTNNNSLNLEKEKINSDKENKDIEPDISPKDDNKSNIKNDSSKNDLNIVESEEKKEEIKNNNTKKNKKKNNKNSNKQNLETNSDIQKENSTENSENKENQDSEVNKEEDKTNKKNSKKENKKTEDIKSEINEKENELSEKSEIKSNENNTENNTEKNEKSDKDLVIVKNDNEETPEYVKEMLRKKRRKMYIIISIVVFILLIILFSTIFAILNIRNSNITKGVKIRNIDISNLTIEEAEGKINSSINAILTPEVTLKYGNDYNITLKPEQIEFKYKIKESISKAFEIGRDGNIVQNNYTLLFTTFLGKNLELEYTYNEELLDSFIADINSKIPGTVVEPSYYIEEAELIINKGKDGIQVKKDELKNLILKEINTRKVEDMTNPEYKQILEIPTENVKTSKIDVEKIYNEVKKEPKDAYFETNPYKIYADTDGIDFNISLDEAKNIVSAEDKDEYIIPLKITKASKTISDLGTEAFPYLVSSFSTKYDASNRNRSINLEIAANKINGKVLMPGEVFSFNKVVGKRTVEEGYKDAKIYADGGVVDGLAGGICQISSTLYNAVLLGNLEIVERRNHSFPTSYVKTGRDATVVYGTIDFQFKNSRTYPIKIEATVKNGIAEFKIHGMQEEKEYEVRIIPVTTQSIPYSTSYIQDPTLLPGQQIVVQAGQPGYKVTTYIEKRLNGELVSKDILSNDTYSPMKTVIRIGSGAPVQ